MTKKYDHWAMAYKTWYRTEFNVCHSCGSILTGKILKQHLREWIKVVNNTIKDLKKKKKDYKVDKELLLFLQDKLKKMK